MRSEVLPASESKVSIGVLMYFYGTLTLGNSEVYQEALMEPLRKILANLNNRLLQNLIALAI